VIKRLVATPIRLQILARVLVAPSFATV
jgi:hypothetical protein